MADTYIAELHRDGVASAAGIRAFESGSEAIEIIFDLAEALPSGERNVTGLLWLTDKALDRTNKTLKAVGVDPDDAAFESEEQLCDSIVGKTFKLVVALEAPNQYHRTEKWICRYINGPKQASTGGALARLRGKGRTAQASLPTSPDDDDSVPF